MQRHLIVFAAFALSFFAYAAQASIALNATRVIFQNGSNEASIGVRNMGGNILVQSWLDAEDNSNIVQHFTLTPQLARVQEKSEQTIRILYEGVGAPSDKESMFWLNVQEIPERSVESNGIQLAVLQRIKVFYRPKGLASNLPEAIQNLEWRYSNHTIQISNPSLYHVTLVGLTAADTTLTQSLVIAPEQTYTLTLPPNYKPSAQSPIRYAAITDFGAYDYYLVSLQGEQPAKGVYTAN